MLEPVQQAVGPLLLQSGAYMQCGYFLTGEHAKYLKQAGVFDYNVNPFTPFFGQAAKDVYAVGVLGNLRFDGHMLILQIVIITQLTISRPRCYFAT